MAHELKHAQTEANLPDSVHLAHDGLTLASLGEAGERAFALDKSRMSEAIRRHAAKPASNAADRFEEA